MGATTADSPCHWHGYSRPYPPKSSPHRVQSASTQSAVWAISYWSAHQVHEEDGQKSVPVDDEF